MLQRIVLIAVGAVALLAIPLWLARNPTPEVHLATLQRGPLVITVATNAKVEPIDDFELRARLDGRIVEIRDEGTHVAAGDVLLRVDAGPAMATLESSRSQRLEAEESLRAARAAAAQAQRRFALDQKLFRRNALAEERYIESEAAVTDARARVTHLEREVPQRLVALDLHIAELQAQIDAGLVLAPFAGVVYRRDAKVGEMAHQGQLLLALADLSRLRLRINVDQVDLGKVQPDNPVVVTANAYPDKTWRGSLREIIPRVDLKENRAVSEALATIDPPTDGLLPGMNVDVDVIVRQAADIAQLPSQAIFAAGDGPFVYRLRDGSVKVTPIELGLSSFDAVEIRQGLELGDEVVLGPAPGLRDGTQVKPLRGDAD